MSLETKYIKKLVGKKFETVKDYKIIKDLLENMLKEPDMIYLLTPPKTSDLLLATEIYNKLDSNSINNVLNSCEGIFNDRVKKLFTKFNNKNLVIIKPEKHRIDVISVFDGVQVSVSDLGGLALVGNTMTFYYHDINSIYPELETTITLETGIDLETLRYFNTHKEYCKFISTTNYNKLVKGFLLGNSEFYNSVTKKIQFIKDTLDIDILTIV